MRANTRVLRWAWLAAMVWANLALGADFGLLTVTDAPLEVIRGDQTLAASVGALIQSGDILRSGNARFAQVEIGHVLIVGMGPASELLIERAGAEGIKVILLDGVGKVQINPGEAQKVVVESPNMRADYAAGSAMMQVDGPRSELFSESCTPRVVAMDDDGHGGAETRLAKEQSASRITGQALQIKPRPSHDFVTAMPLPMRDALFPSNAKAATNALRNTGAASYATVARWIDGPARLRHTLLQRFRARANDAAFRAELESGMTRHPEWKPVLHPPASPRGASAEGQPGDASRASPPPVVYRESSILSPSDAGTSPARDPAARP